VTGEVRSGKVSPAAAWGDRVADGKHFEEVCDRGLRNTAGAPNGQLHGRPTDTLSLESLRALRKITGIPASFSFAFSSSHTLKPLISGMLMSSRIKSSGF
jgi:hypothetical protein